MDATQLPLLITDGAAVPLSGSSFYCPAVAATTTVVAAVSLTTPTTDADVTALSLSCYFFAAVVAAMAFAANL